MLRTDVFIARLHSLLQEAFLLVDIAPNEVKNGIRSISKDERDGKQLIKYMKYLKNMKIIEYCPDVFSSSDFCICYVVIPLFQKARSKIQ